MPGAAFVPVCVKVHGSSHPRKRWRILIQSAIAKTVPWPGFRLRPGLEGRETRRPIALDRDSHLPVAGQTRKVSLLAQHVHYTLQERTSAGRPASPFRAKPDSRPPISSAAKVPRSEAAAQLIGALLGLSCRLTHRRLHPKPNRRDMDRTIAGKADPYVTFG